MKNENIYKNIKKEDIINKEEKEKNKNEEKQQINVIKSIESNNKQINNKENKDKNENLIEKITTTYKFKYKDIINVFLDKVIKEAIEKQNDDEDSLIRARSFDQDLFGKFILQNDNNISKLNKSISDGEDNNFEI